MAMNVTLITESPEEREIRIRKTTLRRIRALAATFGVAILARIFVKNPPPPKTPDYGKDAVRFIPGMLDAIPASERARMDPKLLAKMQQMDNDFRHGRIQTTEAPAGPVAYKAVESPL